MHGGGPQKHVFPDTLEYDIKLPRVNKTYTHDGGRPSHQPGLDRIITPLGPVWVQFDLCETSCRSGKTPHFILNEAARALFTSRCHNCSHEHQQLHTHTHTHICRNLNCLWRTMILLACVAPGAAQMLNSGADTAGVLLLSVSEPLIWGSGEQIWTPVCGFKLLFLSKWNHMCYFGSATWNR